MNADTASPTTPPTPAPLGGPQPVVPVPGATSPDQHHHAPAEPNALMDAVKKAWESLKAGKVGNPRIIALVLAVAAILGAWWFFSYASRKTDSALWFKFDEVVTSDQATNFANEPTNVNTLAAKIARLNDLRLRRDALLGKMTRTKLADRVEAADMLEKLRDEFADAAKEFGNDPTLRAQAYREAAEIEMGLVGVPKKGVVAMGGDEKGRGRGQLDKYAELMKKAAEAIGPETDAGKGFLAEAEKYSKDPEAAQLYRQLGTFHANFNNPDPLPSTPIDPNAPKAPDGIGGPKPTNPGDAPKPPEGNPFDKK
jgi:hypothetical protein